jgi:hypothetical protein
VSLLEAKLRATLTMAACVEARRQAARERGDELAERAADDELRRLWRLHGEIERELAETASPAERVACGLR